MKREPGKIAWVVVFVATGLIALVGVSRMFGGMDRVPWVDGFEAGKSLAAERHAQTLVYFTAGWCSACQDLRRETWSDKRVAAAVTQGYVPVRVDVDKEPSVAFRYQVDAIPMVAVIDAQGRVVKQLTGVVGADHFLEWLKSK